MLPFGGQGSNQAMEDGGALGYLLRGVEEATAIPARLALFDRVRRNRASRVQILSKVRIGREKEVEQELKKYMDTADAGKHNITNAFRNEGSLIPPFAFRSTRIVPRTHRT